MIESLEREIRDLRSLFWSERDPDGRGFAPLADAYRRAGDFRQALELVNDGLDRLPTFATGHVVSASVHFEAGLVEEAQLAASRALELDSENVRALRTLADALTAQGDEAGASEARARLHTLEPPEDEAAVEPAEESAPVAEPEVVTETVEEAEEEAPALDIGALAPEEPEAAALEEEEAPALDIGALAPEEPEAVALEQEGAPALDIGALAPEEPEVAEEEEEVAALDVGALAPEEPEAAAEEEEAPVMDIGALAPDEPAEPWEAEPEPEAAEPPIYTRTMAELYVRQGLVEQAMDVYRHLLESRPDDAELQARLAELEAAGAEESAEGDLEESEIHARHLASAGERGPKVETPFAWTEQEAPDAGAEAPPISEYFRRMLDWTPGEDGE